MPDVSAKIKGLNVEFNDNLTTSPNISSGDDIKTSFARIHKRFSQMKSAAYIDASISNNKTITLGDSSIGVVSISQNQGLTDIEKTNARTNIGAGTSNFNGSFNSLNDKPTTIAGYGITDAFSGSFTDLTNKPTTISGYGITDAKIQNGTITLGSNTITPITSFSSLDSSLVGGSGKYISSISETDGIISATETTLDTVPTENSTNAITSGAVYTDSANQQLEINYAINTGAKNKLIITNQNNTLTVNGITFTKNDDQTITATGTATANADYPLNASQPLEIGQSYTLSGCPNGGGADNFLLRQLSGAIDYGNGATFTAESSSGNFYIRIRNGYAIQGSITFKPMLRYEEIKGTAFKPYAPTNRELYEEETQLQARVDQIVGTDQQIPSNADLNTYVDTGVFQILTTAIAKTIVNIPADCKVAGSIEVKKLNGSAIIQFYYPNWASSGSNPGSFYFRQRTGATAWTNWYYFSGTQVATVQSVNSLSTLNLSRNDLNESIGTNIESLDSIPEESESYNTDEELTEEQLE